MNEWMVQKAEHVTDMVRVKEANPFSGISVASLTEEYNSPTTDLGDFTRLKCNRPARSISSAITEGDWSKALHPNLREIPDGEHVSVGMDVAWKKDTFAIVPCWQFLPVEFERLSDEVRAMLEEVEMHTRAWRLLGTPRILTPPRDGSTMHPDKVKIAFEELHARNPVDVVVIDMQRAEDIAAWIEDEFDIGVLDRTQSNALAVEDFDAFMKGLRSNTLWHTGDRGLRKHVMNAISRRLPSDKYRFDRPSQSRARRKQEVRVIDALTAAAMVNQYFDGLEPENAEPLVSWR